MIQCIWDVFVFSFFLLKKKKEGKETSLALGFLVFKKITGSKFGLQFLRRLYNSGNTTAAQNPARIHKARTMLLLGSTRKEDGHDMHIRRADHPKEKQLYLRI